MFKGKGARASVQLPLQLQLEKAVWRSRSETPEMTREEGLGGEPHPLTQTRVRGVSEELHVTKLPCLLVLLSKSRPRCWEGQEKSFMLKFPLCSMSGGFQCN